MTYDKFKNQFNKWRNNPNVLEKLNSLDHLTDGLDKIKVSYGIIQLFLDQKELLNTILELLENFLSNIEEFIFLISFLDELLYNSLYNYIIQFKNNKPIETNDLLSQFESEFFDRINIFDILEGVLVFQEKKDVEIILKNLSDQDFKKYLSDWILKYAQIIEGPLKHALLLLLKLDYISQSKNHKNLDIKTVSIGYLLGKLKIHQILAKYRNAIFHQNIYLKREHEVKDNQIRLYDRKRKLKVLTLEDYYGEFYKLVFFIFTFYLAILKVYLSDKEPNQIIQKIMIDIRYFLKELTNNLSSDSIKKLNYSK